MISLVKRNTDFEGKNISAIDPFVLEVIKSIFLYLHHNELKYLLEDLFKYNTKFENLNISSNKISKIHPLVFHKLQNLTKIDLDENELMEIDENLFERSTKLKIIYLSTNRITFFHSNTFKHFKNLVILTVWNNQLAFFDLNSISWNKLNYLGLNVNDLTGIRYHNLNSRYPKFSRVPFTQNKLNCTCATQLEYYLGKGQKVQLSISCISDDGYKAIM